MKGIRETDLYPPVKTFLEARGFTVKGEINECDVLGVRGNEEPLVVELKTSFNLAVVLQAVERLSLTPEVYIAVPAATPALKKERRRVLKLLRMLGIGLMAIDPRRSAFDVEVLLDPGPYSRRRQKARLRRLMEEFHTRSGDPEAGGADKRRGRMTAYRQRVLRIARFLQESGPTKASVISQTLCEPEARIILYRNVYGWFEKKGKGIYEISLRGSKEIAVWIHR